MDLDCAIYMFLVMLCSMLVMDRVFVVRLEKGVCSVTSHRRVEGTE